jgi:hypothetical protein
VFLWGTNILKGSNLKLILNDLHDKGWNDIESYHWFSAPVSISDVKGRA